MTVVAFAMLLIAVGATTMALPTAQPTSPPSMSVEVTDRKSVV